MRIDGRDIRITGRLVRTARLDGDRYEFIEEPADTIAALRRSNSRVDLFTFTQRLSEPTPKFDYPLQWDNFAALPITTFDDWWSGTLDNKTRNMIRRAEKKGVEVREVPFGDDLVRDIWEVYNESPVRQGKPYAHYGKDIETVHREEATFLDRSAFLGAYLDGSLIGFIKLTWDDALTQAGCMNIVSMIKHRDKAPTNALIAQAVRACAARGIRYLAYASFTYGNKQPDSLSDFKKNNGFERIEIPRYYVPLTLWGGLALRLGLQRKVADRVPEVVMSRLRVLRNLWNERRYQAPRSA